MFAPIIEARVKKSRELFVFWVKAGKVCAFVPVAVVAGEREIFRRIFAVVLARNDVFDVKPQWLEILM